MRAKNLKSLFFAAASAGLVTGAQAQISFGPAGTPVLDFAVAPTVASGWSTLNIAGGGLTVTTEAGMDAALATTTAASIATALGVSATVPPSTANIARYNSALTALQTRPTGNGYLLLMATLKNDSGADVSAISINYDLAVQSPATGELPGHFVYYSLTGAAGSWVKVPELSGDVAGAKSVVVGITGGTWANGGNLYIVWADDNADAITDPSYTIDNFQVGTGTVTPPAIATQPATTTVAERQVALLSVGATGSGLTYQWYRGTPASPTVIPGATASTLRVTNMTGLVRYPWSTPLDNGNYFVRVSGATGSPVDSTVAGVTVTPDTTAPALSYARCGAGTIEQVVITLSEPLNNAGGEVTDASNWEIRTLDNSAGLGIVNITYVDNGQSTVVTLDIDVATPRDVTKGYKVSLLAGSFVNDTAVTANALNGPSSTPVLCFTNLLLTQTAAWKVNDEDVDPIDQLPVTWKDVAYNDSAAPWATGVGPFDAKRGTTNTAGTVNCRDVGVVNFGAIGTCLNLTSPVTATNLITSYFRTKFNYGGNPTGSVIVIYGKFDDGVVMYLNGAEIWRLGVAAGVVTNGTFANRTVNDGDADDTVQLVSPAAMVSGENLLAFSLHQVNLTSSDSYARVNVAQLVAEPPAVAPVLTITSSGANVVITSTAAGTLISSDSINAPRSGWTNEGAIGAGAPGVTIPASSAKKFYSVRVP